MMPAKGKHDTKMDQSLVEGVARNGAKGSTTEQIARNGAKGSTAEQIARNGAKGSTAEQIARNGAKGSTTEQVARNGAKGSTTEQVARNGAKGSTTKVGFKVGFRRFLNEFRQFLSKKRNEIIAATLGFIITTIIVGTLLMLGQEWLKRWFFTRSTTAELTLQDSAIGVFSANNSSELIQLLAYDLTASDLIRNVKITAIFKNQTEITDSNVVYSVDITGYTSNTPQSNHVIIKLNHELDLTKRARIYFKTRRTFPIGEDANLERPNIHVEAEDKNGGTVYR